ncbi:FecR domain-containing protein [Vogesella sp. DC21W]|uniref:FecR domain-containing protein n=1 Tax=Vogesella aquatica TaxID=2984206 RepID=A0ABT5IYC5_9NEIS|nr:FecR domain-containing protein [Vogesella aquatica]MDC7717584.1 FecR domain-containing protein [Vogesella aquatica]
MHAKRLILLTFCLASASHADNGDWQYTIQPGDTLWSIARTHLSTLAHAPALQKLNAIRNPYALKPHSTLRIPLQLMRQHSASATVTDLVGEATLDGQTLEAGQSYPLAVGKIIRTGPNSALKLLMEEGSLVSIGPNARFAIKEATFFPSTGASNTWLNIESGSIDNSVVKNPLMQNRHTIQTPSAITAVRGTGFRVNVADADSSATEVVEGQVEVSGHSGSQAVAAGFGSVTRRGEAPGGSIMLPAAPDLSPLAAVQSFSPAILQWTPAEGMAAYQANLMRTQPGRRMMDDKLLKTAQWYPALDNGHYQLTVRSQLPNGLQGYPAKHDFVVNAHPAPPLVLSPADGRRLAGRELAFRFSGDTGTRYRVQLSRQPDMQPIAASWDISQPDTTRQLAEGGQWYWQVARLDKQGKPGPYSQTYSLQADTGLWRASYPRGMQISGRPYPLSKARYQLTLQLLGRDSQAFVYSNDQPVWQDSERLYSGRYRVSYKVSTPDGYQATELEDILLID